jgi:uncharacterized protein (UPF0332 family)
MITENIKALMKYRLDQAEESLEASKVLIEKGLYRPAVNRAYYAMFYAPLAILAAQKKETSKHGGLISLFDKEFVKKGIFPKNFSKWLHDAFDLRQRSDYTAGQIVTKEEADQAFEKSSLFVQGLKKTHDGNL